MYEGLRISAALSRISRVEKLEMELSQSYFEANNDLGQLEGMDDWKGAISDGSEDW